MVIVAFAATMVWAQVPNEEDMWEPTFDVPVNSGILLMLAAGVGYGLKKLSKRN